MNIREIDLLHTAGVYILAGQLDKGRRKATPHFYVGESVNVHGRLQVHQKLDETASDSRRRNNYDRWFERKCRMVLLTEIANQYRRRASEERFMAGALLLGLPLLNRKQPNPHRIQILGALDKEIETLKEALDFLEIRRQQYKPVVFPLSNLIVMPRTELLQEATS
jgi:hypothetical protein